MSETRTPRTDKVARTELKRGLNNQFEVQIVPADFARQLERELANTKGCAPYFMDIIDQQRERIAALERELSDTDAARLLLIDSVEHHQGIIAGHVERIAALEQTLREVRGVIDPYMLPTHPNRAKQALALIDRTLEPRDGT